MNLHQAVLMLNGDGDVDWELEGVRHGRLTVIFRGTNLDSIRYRADSVLRSLSVIPNPAAESGTQGYYRESAESVIIDITRLLQEQSGDFETGGNIYGSWQMFTMPDVLADRIYNT